MRQGAVDVVAEVGLMDPVVWATGVGDPPFVREQLFDACVLGKGDGWGEFGEDYF